MPYPDAFSPRDLGVQTDHRFPYVVGHRYEFQAVPAQGVQLAIHGGDAQGTADSAGSNKNETSVGLDVVFSVMSAYSEEAKLCKTDALRLSLPAFQAPTCLPPKTTTTTPVKTAGDISTASSAARDTTSSTLPRPSQDHRRPDCRSPSPARVSAALAGPCNILSPSSAEHADSANQRSSITPTQAGAETAVASRSPTRSLPGRTMAGVRSGTAEGPAQGGPLRKEPPRDEKHGDYYSTRIAEAGQSGFGVEVGVDNEHRSKQELDTTTRERDSRYHRSPVPTELLRNTAGANGNVEEVTQRTVGSERYANVDVAANAADRSAPQSSTLTTGPPIDFPRRDIPVPETTGGHSAARLKWNPAWERQPPSAAAPAPSQSSLPYIRQQAGARSAFGGHDSVGSRTPRDAFTRDRLGGGHSPPYEPEPMRRKRHTAVEGGGEATPPYRRPRPTHEAHHDTTAAVAAAAAAAAPYHDHSHREKEQYATLPHRRRFDGDERQAVLSPSPQDSSSSGREDGRRGGVAAPERRWDYRLRQRSAEDHQNLAPDRGPGGMHGPGRRYDRRASEGEDPRADRRGWREDEIPSLTTTGSTTHELRRNPPRDSVTVDRSQRTRRRSPEKDPRLYEYQAHDDHRAEAPSYERTLRSDARLPPGVSRWERGVPRDPWRAARSTKGRGEHAMGFAEAVFDGGGRGYPQRAGRPPEEDPRVQRGGEEARYGREPVRALRAM